MLAGLMAALLAAGVLAARSLARRAIGPVEYLGRSADALGQGKELGYAPQGLAEIDNVAARMREAARQIRQSQDELERRVAEAVAAIVRQRDPRLPVVLATGYTEQQPGLPGVQVLAKPYAIERLVTLLARVAAYPN